MIIDCHVHPLGDWEAMLAAANRHRIDRLCLFGLANAPLEEETNGDPLNPPPRRVQEANDHVARLLALHPDRTCGFCFLNPRDPVFCAEEIERCIGQGPFIGIKLWIALRASDPRVDEVASVAERFGVPILLHCWNKTGGNLATESTTADVAGLASRHPKLTLIAAHLTGIGERGVCELAPHPNVLVDTSGGDAEAGILEYALKELGAERILYGSDAPIRDFGSALARVQACAMTEAERRAILAGNFLRRVLHAGKVAHAN
jgi:uncharacterized protein